jgi:hypothetical protein
VFVVKSHLTLAAELEIILPLNWKSFQAEDQDKSTYKSRVSVAHDLIT